MDLSNCTLTATPLSVEEQIKRNEERRTQWYSDKAEFLLSCSNKKELIVGLISDFNNILGCTKEIEQIVRQALKDAKPAKMKLALRSLARMFPARAEQSQEQEEEQQPEASVDT